MVRVRMSLTANLQELIEKQDQLCQEHKRVKGWWLVTNGKSLFIISEGTKLKPNEVYAELSKSEKQVPDDYYDIVAFDSNWKRKGYVDPSIRDDVSWIRIEDAISFIQNNKPKDEHWLIELNEHGHGK